MSSDLRPYASPFLMHEIEDESAAVQIFYIYVIEQPEGFRWQVRGHDLRDPIETSADAHRSLDEARDGGQKALEKVCQQYRRFGLAR